MLTKKSCEALFVKGERGDVEKAQGSAYSVWCNRNIAQKDSVGAMNTDIPEQPRTLGSTC